MTVVRKEMIEEDTYTRKVQDIQRRKMRLVLVTLLVRSDHSIERTGTKREEKGAETGKSGIRVASLEIPLLPHAETFLKLPSQGLSLSLSDQAISDESESHPPYQEASLTLWLRPCRASAHQV